MARATKVPFQETRLGSYLVRRVLLIVPTLIMVYTIVFAMTRLLPGDIIDSMTRRAQRAGGDIDREALERFLGLDAPAHIQYFRSLGDLFLSGSLGTSLQTGLPVTEMILDRIGVTLELGIIALLIAVLISLPIGIYSAIRQDSVGDYVGRSLAIVLIAAPSFWVATLILIYPSIWWGWSPPVELVSILEDPIGNVKVYLIPAFILGMAMAGTTMRMTRTMMLEVLRQDFIRTAFSKGLSENIVIIRHALKNALIPVVTIAGAELPVLIGGAVIIEQIFSLPGTGRLMVDALHRRDYTLISGINLFFATAVIGANLLIDLSYAYLDPRIRYR